jgi:hypothetical protein
MSIPGPSGESNPFSPPDGERGPPVLVLMLVKLGIELARNKGYEMLCVGAVLRRRRVVHAARLSSANRCKIG